MSKILFAAVLLSSLVVACNEEKKDGAPAGANTGAPAGAQPTGAAAAPAGGGDASCEAVVAKLASYDKTAGEPEKKLWTKMCADMPPAARSCIVASKTEAERDNCMKGEKLIK